MPPLTRSSTTMVLAEEILKMIVSSVVARAEASMSGKGDDPLSGKIKKAVEDMEKIARKHLKRNQNAVMALSLARSPASWMYFA